MGFTCRQGSIFARELPDFRDLASREQGTGAASSRRQQVDRGSLANNLLRLRKNCEARGIMAWGAPRGVDDLIAKLRDNKTVRPAVV